MQDFELILFWGSLTAFNLKKKQSDMARQEKAEYRKKNMLSKTYSILLKIWKATFVLFVCLFRVFLFHSRILHYFFSVLQLKDCKVLTYSRHPWPLGSEGSFECHTFCDTGHSFIFSNNPCHCSLKPSVCQWNYQYLFYQLMSVVAEIRTPKLLYVKRTLSPTALVLPPRLKQI